MGGMFDTLAGQPRSNLGRLDADGRLDTLFDPQITWDGQHGSDYVTSLAVQADGNILAGGWFGLVNGQPRLHLARLNPDGILDPSLNPQPNSKVGGLAVQSDGGVLVGGSLATLAGQPRNHLGRLYPDGSLDATLDPRAEGGGFALATQADGQILVGGGLSNLGGQPRQQLGRLKSDGSLDDSFNPTMSGDPALPMAVFSVAVQEDGRILMGGTLTNLCGQPRRYLGRLNPDGSLDSGFDPGASDYVLIQALQPDGKILIGGAFTNLAGQARNSLLGWRPTADWTRPSILEQTASSGVWPCNQMVRSWSAAILRLWLGSGETASPG